MLGASAQAHSAVLDKLLRQAAARTVLRAMLISAMRAVALLPHNSACHSSPFGSALRAGRMFPPRALQRSLKVRRVPRGILVSACALAIFILCFELKVIEVILIIIIKLMRSPPLMATPQDLRRGSKTGFQPGNAMARLRKPRKKKLGEYHRRRPEPKQTKLQFGQGARLHHAGSLPPVRGN